MTDFPPVASSTLSRPAHRVLDVLRSETAQRLRGLYVSNLAQATEYSPSTVNAALAEMVEQGLVHRSYHRSSRGYNYTAVTQAEVDEQTARQSLVSRLEDALGALVPGADFDVAGLVHGGVSLRMPTDVAEALADALAALEG